MGKSKSKTTSMDSSTNEDLSHLNSIMVAEPTTPAAPAAPPPTPAVSPVPSMPYNMNPQTSLSESRSAITQSLNQNSQLALNNLPSEEFDKLKVKIKSCFATMSYIKDLKPKNLDKLSEDELLELDKRIRERLGGVSSINTMAKSVPTIVKLTEDILAEFTPLRIQGTHLVFMQDELQDLLKYCIIDSGFASLNITPQQRLLHTFLTTAAIQHSLNSSMERLSPEQRAAIQKAAAGNNPENANAVPDTESKSEFETDRFGNF